MTIEMTFCGLKALRPAIAKGSFSLAGVSLVVLIVLSGCVSSPAKTALQPALPAWVTAPPRDSDDKLWGVGEGSDFEAAKRAALKDIAAKLRVAISARLESRVTVTANSIDKFARTNVAEDVQRTEFKNVTLEQSAPSSSGIYALVSVDRRALVADAEHKLASAEQEIAKANGGKTALERFIALQRVRPVVEKAFALAQVLSAASRSFDIARLARIETKLAEVQRSSHELIFEIKARPENQDVAQALGGFLNEAGMRTGSGGTPLQIDATASQDLIFGSKTVQMRVVSRVVDEQGRTLASREITVQGSSMKDHTLARQAAIRQLGEKLREMGPVAGLGFAAS